MKILRILNHIVPTECMGQDYAAIFRLQEALAGLVMDSSIGSQLARRVSVTRCGLSGLACTKWILPSPDGWAANRCD